MSAPPEFVGWVARAEEDFTLARSALRRKRPLMWERRAPTRLQKPRWSVTIPGTTLEGW